MGGKPELMGGKPELMGGKPELMGGKPEPDGKPGQGDKPEPTGGMPALDGTAVLARACWVQPEPLPQQRSTTRLKPKARNFSHAYNSSSSTSAQPLESFKLTRYQLNEISTFRSGVESLCELKINQTGIE
jgi:hypothetical protein